MKVKLARRWKLKKVTVVLVLTGALVTVTDRIEKWIKNEKMALIDDWNGSLFGMARIIWELMNIFFTIRFTLY